jgi:hypothetical protein
VGLPNNGNGATEVSDTDLTVHDGGRKAAEVERLDPVAYKGKPVITTDLLAQAYGASNRNIQDNYLNNAERFVEGVHFYKVIGSALRSLKNQPAFIGLVGKNAPHLTLWTERGAARHAKMLETDQAWEIFEKLEDSYFNQRPKHLSVTASVKEAASVFKGYYSIARVIGLDRNQAAISAGRATHQAVGADPLEVLGLTALLAPQQAPALTPSDIGSEFDGKSAISINKMLFEAGYQEGRKDAKGRHYWVPTEKGQPFAVFLDTGKKHGDGTPVRQLKWSAEIISVLREAS